jgi:hypothetical protein
MQENEFKNEFIRNCAMKVRESHNLIFGIASSAISNDNNVVFNDVVRDMLQANTMYAYRIKWGVDYDRLYQVSVISLCSEIEYFFKALFEKYNFEKMKSGFGFYQRIDDVVSSLIKHKVNLSGLQSPLKHLELAFQVRHIGVHNMGFVDQKFQTTTGLGQVGEKFNITQTSYLSMYDACVSLLRHLDKTLP